MPGILVIPDLHNRTDRAEAIIRAHGGTCDKIVLLGDYFDGPSDSAEDAVRVAVWLRSSMKDRRRIHLIGNHDLPYVVPPKVVSHYWCSGWTATKWRAVQPIISELEPHKFRAAIEADGWLISHAGLFPGFLEGRTNEEIISECNAALIRAMDGEHEWLLEPGIARGGSHPLGGVTWLDWNAEFQATAGYHQILGHSRSIAVRVKCRIGDEVTDWALGRHSTTPRLLSPLGARAAAGVSELPTRSGCSSINWCLDTGLSCVAKIAGESVSVIWV